MHERLETFVRSLRLGCRPGGRGGNIGGAVRISPMVTRMSSSSSSESSSAGPTIDVESVGAFVCGSISCSAASSFVAVGFVSLRKRKQRVSNDEFAFSFTYFLRLSAVRKTSSLRLHRRSPTVRVQQNSSRQTLNHWRRRFRQSSISL